MFASLLPLPPLVFYLETAPSGAPSRAPDPRDHRLAVSQREGRSPRPGTLRPGACPRRDHAPEPEPEARAAPYPPRPPLSLIGNILLFLSLFPPLLPSPVWIRSAPGRACGCRADSGPGRAVSGGGWRAATRREAAGGWPLGARGLWPRRAGPRRRILRWSLTFGGSRRASAGETRWDRPRGASSLGLAAGRLSINARRSGSETKAVCWGARWAGEKGALRGWLRARPPRLLYAELLWEGSAPRTAALATRTPLSGRPAPPGGLRRRLAGVPSVQLSWAGAWPAGKSKGLL